MTFDGRYSEEPTDPKAIKDARDLQDEKAAELAIANFNKNILIASGVISPSDPRLAVQPKPRVEYFKKNGGK